MELTTVELGGACGIGVGGRLGQRRPGLPRPQVVGRLPRRLEVTLTHRDLDEQGAVADPVAEGASSGESPVPLRFLLAHAQGTPQQHLVRRRAGLALEERPQHREGVVRPTLLEVAEGDALGVEPDPARLRARHAERDTTVADGPVDDRHRLVLAPGRLEALEDRAVLRVPAALQDLDGRVDVSVVVGELEQHLVDLVARRVRIGLSGLVDRGDPLAVDREGLGVERRGEGGELEVGPAGRGLPEFDEPSRQLGRIGVSLTAGASVEVASPPAGVAEHAPGVVGLLGDPAETGQGLEQRREGEVCAGGIEVGLEVVEHLRRLVGDAERPAVVHEAAGAQGRRDPLEQLGPDHVGGSSGQRGAVLEQPCPLVATRGELDDQRAQVVALERGEQLLHGREGRRTAGAGGRRLTAGLVERREAESHEVPAEEVGARPVATAGAAQLAARPVERDLPVGTPGDPPACAARLEADVDDLVEQVLTGGELLGVGVSTQHRGAEEAVDHDRHEPILADGRGKAARPWGIISRSAPAGLFWRGRARTTKAPRAVRRSAGSLGRS